MICCCSSWLTKQILEFTNMIAAAELHTRPKTLTLFRGVCKWSSRTSKLPACQLEDHIR